MIKVSSFEVDCIFKCKDDIFLKKIILNSKLDHIDHYQDRKIVLFEKSHFEKHIKFIFIQLDKKNNILPVLDCANASAAIHRLIGEKQSRQYNIRSKRKILVYNRKKTTNHYVRFYLAKERIPNYHSSTPQTVSVLEKKFNFWEVLSSNNYLFIQIPFGVDTVTFHKNATYIYNKIKKKLLLKNEKVLFFKPSSNNRVYSLCFYDSCIHKSHPGSGVSILARFLTDTKQDSKIFNRYVFYNYNAELSVSFHRNSYRQSYCEFETFTSKEKV